VGIEPGLGIDKVVQKEDVQLVELIDEARELLSLARRERRPVPAVDDS